MPSSRFYSPGSALSFGAPLFVIEGYMYLLLHVPCVHIYMPWELQQDKVMNCRF